MFFEFIANAKVSFGSFAPFDPERHGEGGMAVEGDTETGDRTMEPSKALAIGEPTVVALRPTGTLVPRLIAVESEAAALRYLDFFTANIRNPHTRRAYARAATEFFGWLEARGVTQLAAIESAHVATNIEQPQRARSAPTAKLRMAALRRLFDWMVTGEIMPTNPSVHAL